MWIAKRVHVDQLDVPGHLRDRVKPRPGVIEVDVTVLIEARILRRSQRVEVLRRLVLGVLRQKLLEAFHPYRTTLT